MTHTLVVHFMEAPGALEALAELPVDKRRARLTAIGHEKASGERDDLEVFSGQFTYSVDEVRKLLERGALEDTVEGFDAASEDAKAALLQMQTRNTDYASALVNKYVFRQSPARVSPEAKVLERAVDSLTTHMNRVSSSARYEFSNGDRFRNNKQALNQGDRDYDGEGRYDD